MVEYQLPLSFISAYLDLSDKDNELVRYFSSINIDNIRPVMKMAYPGPGPTGYETSLILSRILKVKQVFISDRILTRRLRENATYWILCGFKESKTPAHNTYNTLRRKLKAEGFAQIHEKLENATIHVTEHDIVLTQDIISEYRQTAKISPLRD